MRWGPSFVGQHRYSPPPCAQVHKHTLFDPPPRLALRAHQRRSCQPALQHSRTGYAAGPASQRLSGNGARTAGASDARVLRIRACERAREKKKRQEQIAGQSSPPASSHTKPIKSSRTTMTVRASCVVGEAVSQSRIPANGTTAQDRQETKATHVRTAREPRRK